MLFLYTKISSNLTALQEQAPAGSRSRGASRYEENRGRVLSAVREMLPDVALEGQWSINIMQNGGDFWLIDMAAADTSALKECIPEGKLKKSPENWIPRLE